LGDVETATMQDAHPALATLDFMVTPICENHFIFLTVH
jgi:hypothetical protein